MAITLLSNYPKNSEYLYMLLDRLRSDCDYFLGYGNRSEKYLWGLNTADHIAEMEEIYNYLDEKPEWLTAEEIAEYKKIMCCKHVMKMV